MPSYSYTAINDAGIKKKGILSADSEREARKLVKDLKLTPLKISESKNLDKTLRIKNKDIVLMTRQLATLLEASTPIVDSIDITARQTKNKNLIQMENLFSFHQPQLVMSQFQYSCHYKKNYLLFYNFPLLCLQQIVMVS